MPSSPFAGRSGFGVNVLYNKNLNHGGWDVSHVDFSFGGATAARTLNDQAFFVNAQEVW